MKRLSWLAGVGSALALFGAAEAGPRATTVVDLSVMFSLRPTDTTVVDVLRNVDFSDRYLLIYPDSLQSYVFKVRDCVRDFPQPDSVNVLRFADAVEKVADDIHYIKFDEGNFSIVVKRPIYVPIKLGFLEGLVSVPEDLSGTILESRRFSYEGRSEYATVTILNKGSIQLEVSKLTKFVLGAASKVHSPARLPPLGDADAIISFAGYSRLFKSNGVGMAPIDSLRAPNNSQISVGDLKQELGSVYDNLESILLGYRRYSYSGSSGVSASGN
jgi:hypothetical protein